VTRKTHHHPLVTYRIRWRPFRYGVRRRLYLIYGDNQATAILDARSQRVRDGACRKTPVRRPVRGVGRFRSSVNSDGAHETEAIRNRLVMALRVDVPVLRIGAST
jgi:hypothetical protein